MISTSSRVLPGFQPDSKMKMLLQLSDQVEIVIVINAGDIEKSKVRGDIGITYDADVLRLIDAFRGIGLFVGSVVISQYSGQSTAESFKRRLETLGVKVFLHYPIEGYPSPMRLKLLMHAIRTTFYADIDPEVFITHDHFQDLQCPVIFLPCVDKVACLCRKLYFRRSFKSFILSQCRMHRLSGVLSG